MVTCVVLSCFTSLINHAFLVGESNNSDDNSWFGSPNVTVLQSKRKQDETPLHKETQPQQDKEDRKRRRVEVKRQKLKTMAVDRNVQISKPKAPLAVVSLQKDAPKVLEDVSSSSTSVSMTCPHEERLSQLSRGLLDLQAGFKSEGVSMDHPLRGNSSDLE